MIINKKHRVGEKSGELFLVFQFVTNTLSPSTIHSSRSGDLRPSSDNSKDDTHTIFILMHIGNILLFIQILQNKHKIDEECHTPGRE